MHMMERMPWVESRPSYGPFSVPAPLAFFGVLVAYMLGMLMGVMMGKKAALMSGMGAKAWKMKHHHHHGWGDGPCGKSHGHHGWAGGGMASGEGPDMTERGGMPQEDMAAPGAQPGERRNEGE